MPSYVKKTITKLKDVLLQYNKTIIKLSRKYFAMFKQTKPVDCLKVNEFFLNSWQLILLIICNFWIQTFQFKTNLEKRLNSSTTVNYR